MKKFVSKIGVLALSFLLLFGCSSNNGNAGGSDDKNTSVVLTVGATEAPHAIILEHIKEDLAAVGVDLVVKSFGDYTLLNPSLNDKQIDANFFQHIPYLENYVNNSGHNLVEVTKVHIEPIGIYSSKINNLDDLPDNAIVAIPNDATNGARALLLLESLGIITLKENVSFSATIHEIADNPKNVVIRELDAVTLPRTLSETDISVINTNFALEAGLSPSKDAIAMESSNSPYANILVVREENLNNEAVQKLAAALNSQKLREFLEENYGEDIVPAF